MSTQPISLSRDLTTKQVMRAELGDLDMAVWRSASGVVSAWENRCPHRGMRLSHGFVRGESLACAYHGWHYNCAGACHYIPAHPELAPPQTIKTNVYNVTEASGLIWVNATGNVAPIEIPAPTTAVRSLHMACSVEAALDAFRNHKHRSVLIQHNQPEVIADAPYVLALTPADSNTVSVYIAFQHVNDTTTVAHITATDNASMSDIVALSRWANDVRDISEVSAGVAE